MSNISVMKGNQDNKKKFCYSCSKKYCPIHNQVLVDSCDCCISGHMKNQNTLLYFCGSDFSMEILKNV